MSNHLPLVRCVLIGLVAWPIATAARADLAEDQAALVQGNTQFAFELYRHLASQSSDDIFFSPLSISAAMSMAYGGARGPTAAEIAETFHFGLPGDRHHAAAGSLLSELVSGEDQPFRLAMANRLWAREGLGLQPAFLDLTSERYGAGVEELDFEGQPEPSRITINGWVADHTAGRIVNLLPQGSITKETSLVLTNAVYLKADWEVPFLAENTHIAPFRSSPVSTVGIPMMNREAHVPYAATADFQIAELDYKGGDASMVVVLPRTVDGLGELEKTLTPEGLEAAMDEMALTRLSLALPKFGTTSDVELGRTLREMGMPTAFSDQADFSGISEEGQLAISRVLHKAYLNVDEKGTEAAAATGIILEPTGALPMPQVSFRADHPFLFFIRDKGTGSIFFMGRVVQPEAPLQAVPEPAAVALAAMALAALVGTGRSRRCRTNWMAAARA